MNLLDYFDAGVASHPDAPCFFDHGRDTTPMTYAQAGALTCQIARGLDSLEFAPGFHGAVLSGNSGAAFVALLGVVRAGGVWLPVNARNSVESNIEFLQDMDCDVLFYQARYAGQVAEMRGKVKAAAAELEAFKDVDALKAWLKVWQAPAQSPCDDAFWF